MRYTNKKKFRAAFLKDLQKRVGEYHNDGKSHPLDYWKALKKEAESYSDDGKFHLWDYWKAIRHGLRPDFDKKDKRWTKLTEGGGEIWNKANQYFLEGLTSLKNNSIATLKHLDLTAARLKIPFFEFVKEGNKDQKKPNFVALCVTGFNQSAIGAKSFMKNLAELGGHTFGMTPYGFGDFFSFEKHPRGHIPDSKIWIEQIIAACKAIKEQFPKSPIILLGNSLGGAMSANAHLEHKLKDLVDATLTYVTGLRSAGGKIIKHPISGRPIQQPTIRDQQNGSSANMPYYGKITWKHILSKLSGKRQMIKIITPKATTEEKKFNEELNKDLDIKWASVFENKQVSTDLMFSIPSLTTSVIDRMSELNKDPKKEESFIKEHGPLGVIQVQGDKIVNHEFNQKLFDKEGRFFKLLPPKSTKGFLQKEEPYPHDLWWYYPEIAAQNFIEFIDYFNQLVEKGKLKSKSKITLDPSS